MSDTTQQSSANALRALVICPDPQPDVPALSRRLPLVLTPFLGKTVLDHALTFLASEGVRDVRLLCSDRPDVIRAAVGGREEWGVKVEVHAEKRELTVAEALAKHGNPVDAAPHAFVLDRLPQMPGAPLWDDYEGWMRAMLELLPVAGLDRVGSREMSPGVIVGLRSRISPTARLIGPCWVGANAFVGPKATLGPNTVGGDGAYIEGEALVERSVVGPDTYVGAMTEVRNSFAWGRQLLNLLNGSCIEISDRFLLHDLKPDLSIPGRMT